MGYSALGIIKARWPAQPLWVEMPRWAYMIPSNKTQYGLRKPKWFYLATQGDLRKGWEVVHFFYLPANIGGNVCQNSLPVFTHLRLDVEKPVAEGGGTNKCVVGVAFPTAQLRVQRVNRDFPGFLYYLANRFPNYVSADFLIVTSPVFSSVSP